MATTASPQQQQQQHLHITIITTPPQWISEEEHEKENAAASSTIEEEIDSSNSITTTPAIKRDKSRPKIKPIFEWQKQKFEQWLSENPSNIYPTREEKEKLAQLLSASYGQITRLFANQRRRVHKIRNKNPINNNGEDSNAASAIEESMTELPEIECQTVKEFLEERERECKQQQQQQRQLSIPPSTPKITEDVSAICSAVADLIHVDHENKKIIVPKKKSRKRKIKNISNDKKVEANVEEILRKMSREEKEERNEKLEMTETELMIDDLSRENGEEMPSIEISSSNPNVETSLLSMVNEVVTQPPNSLQLSSLMNDVNPRLLEAMNLLNKGVSWTHPTILSVVIQIHQHQQQQRELQQRAAYISIPNNNNNNNSSLESSPPPASESSSTYSRSSTKSMDELMSSLSPDECLAINVLTDLANGW